MRAPQHGMPLAGASPTKREDDWELETVSSVCVRGGFQRLFPQLATIVRSIAHPTYALLPSFRRIGEQDAQSGENATRILAVDGHAEPIARFFLAHGFDAFGDETHVVAIAHRRERAEQQRQADNLLHSKEPRQ